MARKLDQSQDDAVENDCDYLFGRRDYVKTGVITTVAGTGLLGASIPVSAEQPNRIQIVGTGSLATYEITVSGTLTDSAQAAFDAEENISGGNTEGAVQENSHAYEYTGTLEDIRLDGDARIVKDGERIDPADTR